MLEPGVRAVNLNERRGARFFLVPMSSAASVGRLWARRVCSIALGPPRLESAALAQHPCDKDDGENRRQREEAGVAREVIEDVGEHGEHTASVAHGEIQASSRTT